jgi:hypothetical protein
MSAPALTACRPQFVPSGPASTGTAEAGIAPDDLGGPADDIAYLHRCGLTRAAIGREAGMSPETLTVITTGTRPVARRTAARLRATRLAWTPPAGHVLALPAVRRLQAMAYIGHPPARLAPALAQPAWLVWEWTTGEHRFMRHHVLRDVDRLYRRRGLTEGPCVDVAAYARAQGWVSALAWDDDTIDDPWGRPDRGPRLEPDHIVDPVAVERALAGDLVVAARLTLRERHVAAQVGSQRGRSAAELSDLLYRTERTVQRVRASASDRAPVDPFLDYYTFADLYLGAAA